MPPTFLFAQAHPLGLFAEAHFIGGKFLFSCRNQFQGGKQRKPLRHIGHIPANRLQGYHTQGSSQSLQVSRSLVFLS